MGIKFKDPARLEYNGLEFIRHFTWRNYEFAKYDDQGNLISAKRNNYAIQLGIGLPF
jgi:outer membrane protein insertion porin family